MLLAVTAQYGMARTTVTVNGDPEAVFDVTDGLVIDFASQAGSLVVKDDYGKQTAFAITDNTVLAFNTVSGVSDAISSASAVALRQNPVDSFLEFTSSPAQACRLSVISLQGALLLSHDGWQGESVDVSTLSPGLYIVNFNNQSIKFYKK